MRLLPALIVPAVFGLLGWISGGVSVAGALAGFAVAFLLYYGIGPGAFVVLFTVFAITWATTRMGLARKQRLGIAERRGGRRNAGQVLANLGVAGACAAVVLAKSALPHIGLAVGDVGRWATIAAVAALAEAAADTASSESGEAATDTAYLVIGFRAVPSGTDGAVTLFGTAAGVAASIAVGGVSVALRVLSWRAAALAAGAGIAGMTVDTLLGATLERRGWLTNNLVNFLSTLAAALLAFFSSV